MAIITALISGEESHLKYMNSLLGLETEAWASFNVLLRHKIMVKITAIENEVKTLDVIKSLS